MEEERIRSVWEVATTAIYKHIEDIEKRLTMAIDQSSQISTMVSERHKDALQSAIKNIIEKLDVGERRFGYIEKEIKNIEIEICNIKNKSISEIDMSLGNIKQIIEETEDFMNNCPNHKLNVSEVIERIDDIEDLQAEQIEKCDWHKIMTEDYETSWKELPNIIKLYNNFKTYRILIIGVGIGILIMSGVGGTELIKMLINTLLAAFIH